METTFFRITQNDGYVTKLFYYETANTSVLGTILILHGMAEHHERYLDFIHLLNLEGFDVYTYDHRGHGTDKKLSELGYVAKKNGASLLIEDARTICNYIKEHNRAERFALFGHSMGSLVLRCLIQTYDDIACAVCSSSSMLPVFASKAGGLLSNAYIMFRGADRRSPFLQNIIFGGKQYTALCTRTTYDWLTRNNTAIGKYMDDPYCGFLCTAGFCRDLAQLAAQAAQKKRIAKTRKDLPILFLTGSKDPVGGYGTQIRKLHKLYTSLGFSQTELIIYEEARHELINELNAEEVCHDIITYLHTHLDK